MKNLLIVVDYQNDFVDGSLGFPKAKDFEQNIVNKIKEYQNNNDEIIFTLDTHYENYMGTKEGENLPVPHCIKGTKGHELFGKVKELANGYLLIEKETFGSKDLGIMLMELERAGETPTEIELVGLCTDICVISNAMLVKAFLPEVPVTVDASCCAGVTPESHSNALEAMKMCQIKVK